MKIDRHHPTYPPKLCQLDEPPSITLSGPLEHDRRVFAIVGSRGANKAEKNLVHQLAYHLAKAGVIVVSGGALGVDATAHEGAMKAGGTTWCVACCGRGEIYPQENKELFERIEASSTSRMIWPFPDGTPKDDQTPRFRNGVLVALAECVVVVRAALMSGSRNAVSWARNLERRLVISPALPWDTDYEGSMTEGARGGADVLWSISSFFKASSLPEPDLDDPAACLGDQMPLRIRARPWKRRRRPAYAAAPLFPVDPGSWTAEETLVFFRTFDSTTPAGPDRRAERPSNDLDPHGTLDAVVEGRSSRGP